MLKSWFPFLQKDPKEIVRKWRGEIRRQKLDIDRDIRSLTVEQKKVERSIKEAVGRNDMASAKILAKELVRSRKAVARLAENKATLDALNIQMGEALQNYRLAKTVKASTKMMASMNKLVKLPQLEKTMKDMSREMAYAGFLSETLNEGVNGAVDVDDTEELADEAVDKVLLEITGETMAQAASVPMARVRGKEREVDDAELNDLLRRVMEEQG
mmetsp:Transcript_5021/g.9941  ORF Transcript_5021/g.9941 Transcript_5021/m.9941 type:complete len:214 (-) Transcript_5021:1951-2592(-)